MNIKLSRGLALFALFSLSACAPQTFEPASSTDTVELNNPLNEEVSSNFFKLSDSQASFEQESLDQNQTTLTFQVKLPNGEHVSNLHKSDFVLKENGVNIPEFKLSVNSQNIAQTVDIVFAVDVTGSMAPVIESAKESLIKFARTSRQKGYHTRMCLVTFGDYTVKHCNRFYDNNPADAATEAQVAELVSAISKLEALKGDLDPGGADKNENPMRALIDSSTADFGTRSQRFMILITDNGFLYSPGNQGTVGSGAPKYSDVLKAITKSQMQVFAVTPSLPGFDKPFFDILNPTGSTGVIEASKGRHSLFDDLHSGALSLDTILDGIISQMHTNYVMEYTVDEVPGLDPGLPIENRKIQITLKSGQTATLTIINTQTNLPTGRPLYKKKWKIGDKHLKAQTLIVKMNGQVIQTGFKLIEGDLVFDEAPARGSKIEVSFLLNDLRDSLIYTPVVLAANEDLNALHFYFNGKKAVGAQVAFAKTLEGNWSVRPGDQVLVDSDPFDIRANGGLTIKILRAK